MVVMLYEEDKLCLVQEEITSQEPRIICSLGLIELQMNLETNAETCLKQVWTFLDLKFILG